MFISIKAEFKRIFNTERFSKIKRFLHVGEKKKRKKDPTLRRIWPRRSRQGALGPGLNGWQRHLHRAHELHIRAREVAPLLGALVVPEEPAEVLRLLLATFAVVVHGQEGGLADCQKISGLQIQVLLLVLRK